MKKIKLLLLSVSFLNITSAVCYAAETNLPLDVVEGGFKGKKIILFEPDVELQRVLASGRTETRADWSENAKTETKNWVSEFLAEGNVSFSEFSIPEDESGNSMRQLMALHSAVGVSIFQNMRLPLPTKKKEGFKWTIGKGITSIAEATDADYGMFVYYRRGYASGGRVATAIVAAYFGAAIAAGYQIGFVTLVDLKTGEFVWFQPTMHAYGDIRDEDDAQYTVASLIKGFPGLELPTPPRNDSRPE